MTRNVLLFVVFVGASGCFVMPPIRAGAGAGGGAGQVAIRNSDGAVRTHGAAGQTQLRAAFTPLVLGRDPNHRRGDLSVGYTLDWESAGGNRHDFRHGPFAEGVWFTSGRSPLHNQQWRFGPTLLAEMRVHDTNPSNAEGDAGYGAAAGILVEFSDTVSGPFLWGGWKGETALGLAARVGVRHVDGGTWAYGIVSVEFRLPGIAAFVVPLPEPRPR